MTPRRQQTAMPITNQPVRMYKYIALTFLLLTVAVFGVIILISSKRAVITIETRREPIDASGTIEVARESNGRGIAGTVTSTLVSLEKTVTPTGTKEEPDIATGTVTLHNESNTNQPLVAVTRLEGPGGVLFRLTEAALVPANGTTTAAVYADEPGQGGNIAPTRFTIPGLNETRQKVVYATSEAPMTGGVKIIGAVNDDDMRKAEKQLRTSFEDEAKKIFGTAYPGMNAVFTLADESYTSDTEIGTTVSAFTVQGSARVIGVFYAEADLRQAAGDLLLERSENDRQLVQPGEDLPTVTLDTFDERAGTARLSVVISGTATLNPESPELDKNMFFGKTEDEVKRYVQTLNRVDRVDVDLSPSWVQTVPQLSEQVKIIVKQVE